MSQQNAVETSEDQAREKQIGRQLTEHRASLDNIQLGSNVQQVSNDLQNLNQGIAASSQARSQEKVLEETHSATQQALDKNHEDTQNHRIQVAADRNADSAAQIEVQKRIATEAFKDDLTKTIEQKKDQEVNAGARAEDNKHLTTLTTSSNQAHQVAFTDGIPSNANKKLAEENEKLADAATPDGKSKGPATGRSFPSSNVAAGQFEGLEGVTLNDLFSMWTRNNAASKGSTSENDPRKAAAPAAANSNADASVSSVGDSDTHVDDDGISSDSSLGEVASMLNLKGAQSAEEADKQGQSSAPDIEISIPESLLKEEGEAVVG